MLLGLMNIGRMLLGHMGLILWTHMGNMGLGHMRLIFRTHMRPIGMGHMGRVSITHVLRRWHFITRLITRLITIYCRLCGRGIPVLRSIVGKIAFRMHRLVIGVLTCRDSRMREAGVLGVLLSRVHGVIRDRMAGVVVAT